MASLVAEGEKRRTGAGVGDGGGGTSMVIRLNADPMIACVPTSFTRCLAARSAVAVSLPSLHETTTSGRLAVAPTAGGSPFELDVKSLMAISMACSMGCPVVMSGPVVGSTEPKMKASSSSASAVDARRTRRWSRLDAGELSLRQTK